MNCHLFKDSIVHFQAGELSAEEHEAMLEHLNGCEGCARRLEVEEGILRGVKAKLDREVAPPGLETRIRAALDAEAPPARSGGWY
ncbi:MAG: hypothetical protein GWN32_03930, partial [Gemmatimonadetes bacterium]|nr:hypothetical protein [Gemmatimonadota bacterium]